MDWVLLGSYWSKAKATAAADAVKRVNANLQTSVEQGKIYWRAYVYTSAKVDTKAFDQHFIAICAERGL